MPSRAGRLPAEGCHACRSHPDHTLSCLARDDVAGLDRARVHHVYQRGQTLFHEGTPPLAVYCIRSGSVRLTRRTGDGREVVVGVRTAGDLAGFRAVFAQLPYGITAETLVPSHICTIPRDVFLEMVRRCPPLALELLRRLALRSRLTEQQLVSLAVDPVGTRLARLLLGLPRDDARKTAAPAVLECVLSREEMALLVGTTRETLSRTLHEFARHGLVELSPAGVRILSVAGLMSFVGL